MIISPVLFFYIEEIKDTPQGLLGITSLAKTTAMCDAGWGDLMGISFQCIKVQVVYYSAWIIGFFGILFLAKAGPYRRYGRRKYYR